METLGQVRQQVIAHVTTVCANVRRATGDDPEPAIPHTGPEPPVWSLDNLAEAYTEAVSMLAHFGMGMEEKYGEDFSAFLGQQAMVYTGDDDPPAGRITWHS